MSIVNTLLDKLSEYIRLKGEKLKLEIIAQVSRLLAHFVAFLMIGLISFFMFTFLSIAAGAYLNTLFESSYLGYLVLAGFYLLCLVILLIFLKSNRMQQWLEVLFIRFSESLNDDKDE